MKQYLIFHSKKWDGFTEALTNGRRYDLFEEDGYLYFLDDLGNIRSQTDWKGDSHTEEESKDSVQVGGDHYSKMAIEPIEFIVQNGLGYIEGNVIKYISRYKNKNGLEDLKKARHYIDMLIEQEEGK